MSGLLIESKTALGPGPWLQLRLPAEQRQHPPSAPDHLAWLGAAPGRLAGPELALHVLRSPKPSPGPRAPGLSPPRL